MPWSRTSSSWMLALPATPSFEARPRTILCKSPGLGSNMYSSRIPPAEGELATSCLV